MEALIELLMKQYGFSREAATKYAMSRNKPLGTGEQAFTQGVVRGQNEYRQSPEFAQSQLTARRDALRTENGLAPFGVDQRAFEAQKQLRLRQMEREAGGRVVVGDVEQIPPQEGMGQTALMGALQMLAERGKGK